MRLDSKHPMLDVAIIGAGLSGLSLAEQLQYSRTNILIFEARDRCGGRILTQTLPNSDLDVDLGPTWIWPDDQPRITALVKRLGLDWFRQWDTGYSLYHVDANAAPAMFVDTQTHSSSRRIQGGCRQLIDGLLQRLPSTMLRLQHRLLSLTDHDTHVELIFAGENGPVCYTAKQVVLAIPPRLLADSVTFKPDLASKLRILMQQTPTWMAGHAKAMLIYPEAFWRRQRYSGNALLPYPGAVLAEIYDACSPKANTAALFGFFGIPAAVRERYRGRLETLIVQQVTTLFGVEAANPQEIIIQDWSEEPLTSTLQDRVPPASHPQYGHRPLCLDHWQDKLYFCATETATEAGGYLEGALEASERVLSALLN